MSKSKKILLAALSLTLFLGSCKDDKEEVKPGNTITAKAGADQNVKVGDVVNLDGSLSTDSQNNLIRYRWAFSKKPNGSTAAIASPTTEKTTFTVDVPGDYQVELTVSNENGESKDQVVINAAVVEPIVLATDIKAKTVLEDRINDPTLPDYIVNANVLVNAELEVKPGVVIAFARDTRLEVNDNGGVLLAKGDSLKPIRLIGKETTKGFWAGVVFRSANSSNTLEWVQLLHAGSKPLTGTIKAGMAVMGGSRAQISIRKSLFENNGGYGLYVESGVILEGFAVNNFKNNAEAAILVDANNAHNLDYNSVFTNGNGRNIVEIYASAINKNGTTETIWSGFKDKTPYRIKETIGVDAFWKLMPGVIIEMGPNARLSIDDGYINAKGTQASKIIIRGVENTPGYWRGLICFSTSDKNVFEYTEISGGGSTALVSGKKTNIAVYGGNAQMHIKNSKIAGSGGYGIYVNYQAKVNDDIETSNVFEGNVEGKLLKE
ncbi:PKD domain-containing protein [Dyadobacter sp. CY323]|uniref:PKD domain-containing protein n=1 Tax=Dyadobacter sp. CY323 TaxID=2907302 RepID=UPI001F287E9B|nr:PKD domain-containing protein [Dyadobacter sp. CY323]MCE6988249.1 PKD domain-containing protein [Dyadobacter sp. CY323]